VPILSAGSEIRGRGPGAGGRQKHNAGITLIEMLVVVSIIGLLAGISYPSVAAGIDSVRMRSATDSVSSILNGALDHAERRQQPVEIVLSVKDNTIALISNEPGFQRQLKLPDGISIESLYPQIAEEEGPRRVIVLPGGTAPGIGVQLINRHGARRLVHLDPMTGFPRVESVTAK
jgi:prepilin-type N-terminal cleavage/methylation domain-containing protein